MIDRAAANLSTKGPELENHIRENNKDGRFNFLNPNDPYYAYYRFKYQEFKEGKAQQPSNQNEEQAQATPPQEPVNLAPKEPEPFEFSAPLPAMSAQDLDIMKLTAQFAARNGRAFINQLAQRESRNYQFDFLRPSHSLFPYFTELVKQYTKVFLPPKDLQEKLKKNIENKYHILDQVKERVEWVAWQEAEKQKRNDEEEKERIAYASIDWNDFVVVETVEFTEADEQMDLPPPMSLQELESMSLAQKRMAALSTEPSGNSEEVAVEQQQEENEDMEQSDEEPTEAPIQPAAVPKIPDTTAPIKIRTDYKPKFLGAKTTKTTVPTEICPRCGEAIPVDEMAEHMRIELLDPKWKEQKMAMEAKQRESNLLQEGNDVAKILKNISGLRPDIFGSDEADASRRIKEQEEQAKKKDKIIWDGHTATMVLANQRAQQTSFEEQMAQLKQHQQQQAAETAIGPQIPGQQNYPPGAYSSPLYYAPGQSYINQAPGMYGSPMGSPMPATSAIPPPAAAPMVAPPPPSVSPAVRKAEDDESKAEKRPRTDEQPAWGTAQIDPSFSVVVQTPNLPDKPEWNLTGGQITIHGLLPDTLVSTLKDRIASQLGMPAGKQKLSTAHTNVVLNNSKTLMFYGITVGTLLLLEVRKR
ncbi:Pre-mRNA splicing factor PRP21 like protein-domain-containing protein [Cokeromyces recurvatus]|uniref:Pre-mRNA splicing factor PRP21 like protein-domain-containing protein n=1 Tax=Cokeromyces recurvatus TaxID=90255 RepID=UPI00221F1ED1|nr:Pre-mRNA splicing factor PRP21 like protein-domain-containing protein [Cokeromyces recurvatus]KAI7905215.1 Pre-mRNA splicing factor PRP21 like protein-domain-containing protein [Cokeromyces recurvatus]